MSGSETCLNICVHTFIFLSFVFLTVSFFSPFWITCDQYCHIDLLNAFVIEPLIVSKNDRLKNIGLIGFVDDNQHCQWVWQSDFALENNMRDIIKVMQGLHVLGLVILIISLCLSTVHICCRGCRGRVLRNVIGGLCLFSVFCIANSLIIFCIHVKDDLTNQTTLSWSLYLAISGITSCLISSILCFVCTRSGMLTTV